MTAILFGENGQTPATRLDNSKNNFERGQVGPLDRGQTVALNARGCGDWHGPKD